MGSDIDWQFQIEPQPGLNGRSTEWPRGKALGGSSVTNGMAHVRGHRWNYDNWADLGYDGWSDGDPLPSSKRSEDFRPEGDEAYHGTDGAPGSPDRPVDRSVPRPALGCDSKPLDQLPDSPIEEPVVTRSPNGNPRGTS